MTQQVDVSLSVLILAGGLSTRMGTDKALVCYEGLPLLLHVLQAAQNLDVPIAIVTPWPERYAALELQDATFIAETCITQGPISGLLCGLEHTSSEWVLLLACDMPKLDGHVLETWSRSLKEVPSDVLALVPRYENRWEPLCAFYRSRCLSSLKSYLGTGRKSFYHWLAENPIQALSVDNLSMFLNCNRREDLTLEV
ncbi:MAG: molybdenum cofactor guanylyltransferase [Anaerolineae bacterium]|nr:molybdenum cofactor guanylyltransferase [Gloeobacterales cyanobacterium ES-bin-313]